LSTGWLALLSRNIKQRLQRDENKFTNSTKGIDVLLATLVTSANDPMARCFLSENCQYPEPGGVETLWRLLDDVLKQLQKSSCCTAQNLKNKLKIKEAAVSVRNRHSSSGFIPFCILHFSSSMSRETDP
jgi:hypothetical protein